MGPRFERLSPLVPLKKSVCPLTDRQMNNPVVGNIIIDALTFTCSALRRAASAVVQLQRRGRKKKHTCTKTSRHLICRPIPKTPSKTIVFVRRNTEVGWEMRGRGV